MLLEYMYQDLNIMYFFMQLSIQKKTIQSTLLVDGLYLLKLCDYIYKKSIEKFHSTNLIIAFYS